MEPSEDIIQTYAVLALDHFLKHKDIVARKLQHARTATKQSLEQVKADPGASGSMIEKMEQYDRTWNGIIADFERNGVTEEELGIIEKIIGTLPKVIKKIYDFLVSRDRKLQALIKEIMTDKYKKALEFVRQRQAGPDRLSGLSTGEFDFENTIAKKARMHYHYVRTV